MSEHDSLNIEVENCGPIVEAKFGMRPLTVFIGPSNTGKSYLAILLYALHRCYNRDGARGYHIPVPTLSPRLRSRENEPEQEAELPKESIAHIKKILREHLSGDSDSVDLTLPSDITEMFGGGMKTVRKAVEREIQRCFGFDDSYKSLIRRGSKWSRIAIARQFRNESTHFNLDVRLSSKKSEVNVSVPEKLLLQLSRREARNLVETNLFSDFDDQKYETYRLASGLYQMTLSRLVSPLNRSAYYLPADRTGIMHAHKVVVSSLLASAPMGGLREINQTSTLSGVLSDFLDQLINIENPRRRRRAIRRKNENYGKEIEEKILFGKIEVSKSSIEYPDFSYRPSKWQGRKKALPLMHASSMVSELAPVVLYLRHLIMPGDILIVEEPESHLHPAMQVEFTRQLAILVKSGVRVIVTTHSEWLLEELANIVRRSEIKDSINTRYVDSEKVSLRPDQVGAWLFTQQKKPLGSVVTEITLDDSGLYPTGFESVASELHNEGSRISWEIDSQQQK